MRLDVPEEVRVAVLAEALMGALPDLVVERHLRHRRAVGGDTKLVAAFVAAVYEELNASRGGAEEAFR